MSTTHTNNPSFYTYSDHAESDHWVALTLTKQLPDARNTLPGQQFWVRLLDPTHFVVVGGLDDQEDEVRRILSKDALREHFLDLPLLDGDREPLSPDHHELSSLEWLRQQATAILAERILAQAVQA